MLKRPKQWLSKEEGIRVKIMIEQHIKEQIKQFQYLGAMVTEDERCEQDIKCRIAMAKQAFVKRKKVLCSNMSMALRVRLAKTLVWPVMMYGSETWILKKEEKRRLEAFEMWIWRRMAKVSWMDRKTNEEVLKMVGEERKLLDVMLDRKKNWIGHISRGDGLMLEVMEACMEGKRGRGRKRIGMLEELMVESYEEMKRKAQNREMWRKWKPRS